MPQDRFRRLSVAGLGLVLSLAGCEPASAPAFPGDPAPEHDVGERPGFIECGREQGPARPLTEAEYASWYLGAWRGDSVSVHEANARGQEAFLARNESLGPRDLAELLADLARIHLTIYEWHAADACVIEAKGSGDDRRALEMHWSTAERHLAAALERAEQATRHHEVLDDEFEGRARCVRTVAATKLGQLERASTASEQLLDEQPCTAWALLVLADALDARSAHVQAHDLYQRVLTIQPVDSQPSTATCQVAPRGPGPRVPELTGMPRPHSRDCSWDRYVRYRMVWSALWLGTIDEVRATRLLQAIATELHPEWDAGARLLADAIEMDVERWR